MTNLITQDLVRTLFFYDPHTGWVTHQTNKVKAKIGDRAGSCSKTGARYRRIFGKKYLEHRIIWLYQFGHFPLYEIDHINHVRNDNRLENLREVTHAQNMKNKRQYTNNAVGCVGASVDSRCGKYRAYISLNGKPKGLGYYSSFEEAVAARNAALAQAQEYHANHGQ